jgi:hypothetical protein
MSKERNAQELANELTEHLFTNGAGEKAQRLVLELPGGVHSGGWGKGPVRDLLLTYFQVLVAQRESWKRRASQHGCDVESGDPDCG